MLPRPKKEKFQQLTEFERRRIIGLREGGFSNPAIAGCVQRNSSTVKRIVKQWSPTSAISSFACLFAGCVAYCACGGLSWSMSPSWFIFCSFKRRTLNAHTSNMQSSFPSGYSKSVWFHATSYSRIYCSAWLLHHMMILDTFFSWLWKSIIYLYQIKFFVH